jgi:uncharacterized protein
MNDQYWKRKSLAGMSTAEWEGLCDGCALCCMHKVEDADTGAVFYTDIACRLLDLDACRCTNYAQRARIVADCLVLSADAAASFDCLPESCAYRRLAQGQDLPGWHPLITGDAGSVHEAGISVRGKAVSESVATDYSVLRRLGDRA